MKKLILITLLFFYFLILINCIISTLDVVVSPNADLSVIKKIAVWRFQDAGNVSNSGDIVTTAIESALMEQGYNVVPYSKIREILSVEIGYREGMSLDAGMLTPNVLSRIHNETYVDAIIIGSVTEIWWSGNYVPECRIATSFKMINIISGEIILSVGANNQDYSAERAALNMARIAIKEAIKISQRKNSIRK